MQDSVLSNVTKITFYLQILHQKVMILPLENVTFL